MAGTRTWSAHWHQYHHHRNYLADSLTRFLHITRRRIPLDRLHDYLRDWQRVYAGAENAGARAWIFRARAADERFIEFIEWQSHDPRDIIESGAIAAALDELNTAFPFEDSETWTEARF